MSDVLIFLIIKIPSKKEYHVRNPGHDKEKIRCTLALRQFTQHDMKNILT